MHPKIAETYMKFLNVKYEQVNNMLKLIGDYEFNEFENQENALKDAVRMKIETGEIIQIGDKFYKIYLTYPST